MHQKYKMHKKKKKKKNKNKKKHKMHKEEEDAQEQEDQHKTDNTQASQHWDQWQDHLVYFSFHESCRNELNYILFLKDEIYAPFVKLCNGLANFHVCLFSRCVKAEKSNRTTIAASIKYSNNPKISAKTLQSEVFATRLLVEQSPKQDRKAIKVCMDLKMPPFDDDDGSTA